MDTGTFVFFGFLSAAILVAVLIWAVLLYKKQAGGDRAISPLQLFTLGVFVSVVSVFIPIFYCRYDFTDSFAFIRPFLISIHYSFQVFIVNSDFAVVKDAVSDLSLVWRVLFSTHAALLYVLAPVLTFSNVLSLFKRIKSEARFAFHRRRPFYIFTELNEKSVVLANNIFETKKAEKPVLVFTNLKKKDDEGSYVLLHKAEDLNAICLKKDITRLKYKGKKSKIEIFFISDHEEQNVVQATEITTDLNKYAKKQNVKLFVFASGKENGYIIDSLDYDNLLKSAERSGFDDNMFKIRRVDCIRQLVWKTVPDMDLFGSSKDHTISVMIAGMGSYGMEFFKMIVWYCQKENYKLEINLFDKGNDSTKTERSIETLLRRRCPELIERNNNKADGDARYSIKCYDNVDFETSKFAALLDNDERLKRTTAVIVALGDDNTNIETAVYLRTVFDRQYEVKAKKEISIEQENPQIYAIVYNSTKYGSLGKDKVEFLKNHKEIPYHIHFIGALEEQYSYDNIYDFELESKAFGRHEKWVKICEELRKRNKGKTNESNCSCGIDPDTLTDWVEKKKHYEQYEYFRLSSMARAVYDQSVAVLDSPNSGRAEHCRWNAYMRSNGYVFNADRADRALQHNDLVTYQELTRRDDGTTNKDLNTTV